MHRTDGSQDRINRSGRNGHNASNLFTNRIKGIDLFRQAWTNAKKSRRLDGRNGQPGYLMVLGRSAAQGSEHAGRTTCRTVMWWSDPMQRNMAVKFRDIRFCAVIPKSRSGPITPDLAVAEVYKALNDDGSLAPKPAIFGRIRKRQECPRPRYSTALRLA